MKKEIKALWHGIKVVFTTVVDWVATLFGMNDNSKYGHVLRRIVSTAFAVAVVLWVVVMLLNFGRSVYRNISSSCDNSGCDSSIYLKEEFNANLFYYADRWGDNGYLADSNGHKLLKHIWNISKPMGGDSLVYFSNGDKHGYFHMRDGRLVIKPVYENAWIFSDGLAAVEEHGRIKFIDTTGRVVIDRGFRYKVNDGDYIFYQGHCAVKDSTGEHMGLIDRNGNWVLPPEFTSISTQDTFWTLRKDDRMALLTFGMDTVVSLAASYLYTDDSVVNVTFADHTLATYDLHGNLLEANLINNVGQLTYDTRELIYRANRDIDEETESYYSHDDYTNRRAVATCLKYEAASGWYGLMTPDGRQITPPSYTRIEAVDKDLYLCKIYCGRGIMLDSKGNRVE